MSFPKPKGALCLLFATHALICFAQQSPQSLPAPGMTGPLQIASPHTVDAGLFGKLDVSGVLSGLCVWQGNPVLSDDPTRAVLSNGEVLIQKTEGWWQFYVQAGAYSIPILGTSVLSTTDTLRDLYGPLPVAFLKLAPMKNLSVLIGELPTLIGPEYTFTFENMNIDRGLLWGQENAINRGVQINDAVGKFSGSLSWNDGFYSNRYSWLTGSLAYAFNSANTLSFDAGGNLGQTAFRTLSMPVQNNGSIYNVIYSYTSGKWIIQPYFQYTDIPTNQKIGIVQGSATLGGALLANYKFNNHLSIAGRGEYISSTGNSGEQVVNLLYGPGSGAWSITVTPTFQDHSFFIRGDFSFVRATSYTPGDGFGRLGMDRNQPRFVLEAGFIF